MLRKILLIGLSAWLLTGTGFRLEAQNRGVSRAWGKAIGRAYTDRDFLIYDAVCGENMLFIVGKAEAGTGFELKKGENSMSYAKDENTDAFLACMSLEGELLWSTYLPALDSGYYNAFATTVEYTQDGFIVVTGNAYQIQDNLENTKKLIPKCPGVLFVFELQTNGNLYAAQTIDVLFQVGKILLPFYIPRVVKSVSYHTSRPFWTEHSLTGFSLCNLTESPYGSSNSVFNYSCVFNIKSNLESQGIAPFFSTTTPQAIYSAAYPLALSEFSIINLTRQFNTLSLTSSLFFPEKKTTKSENNINISSRGINLLDHSPIFEQWSITTEQLHHTDDEQHGESLRFYGYPTGTYVENSLVNSTPHKLIFPGTVQNIHTYKSRYIVQGIHCQNYSNGFFKTMYGGDYAYSHDQTHPIPMPERGFYQPRNSRSTAVPYLLIYDSATLFNAQYPEPIVPDAKATKDILDFEAPLWGSYLDADWLYEDIFHVTDSAQWKDIYQPYEPVLCSYGNTFFLIGNTKSIDPDLIDNPVMTEEIFHHQGVVLAFSASFEGDCPPETTAFEDVRFLCPDDSVELKLAPDYAGFKFRFDPAYITDTAIVLNADSSRAWVKKEGSFAATLDGSALGCPDVKVDTVKISFSPYPEPVSALNPDSTIVACAAVGVVLNAVIEPDTSFSYRWFDGDSVNPKTVRFNNDSLFFASVEVNGYCTGVRDSTRIRFMPPYVNLGKDTLLCADASQTFADTTVLLHLSARQNYFPDADWIFRWQINGVDVSNNDSLLLRYADLEDISISFSTAIITIDVSLSDASAEACTAHDTLMFSLVSLPAPSPNRFLPQSDTLCAHQDLDLLLPEIANEYHAFWLDQDSVLLPYGYDTARYTVQGMRGLDGYGAGTDTREPRFFQLRLDHKLCGVSYFDTLLIYDQVKPAFELPFHDTVICLNEPIELDSLNPFVYRPFYTFEWNDGTKGSGYSFSDSGIYIPKFFVKEDFAVCGYDTASDTIYVRWSDPAQTFITLEDTSFCEKLSVILDATVPFPTTRYSWQEGNLDDLLSPLDDSTLFTPPVLKVDKSVSLALFVVDTMGCVNTRQIAVTEDDCKPNLSIPNVFTPNGDGVNDVLKFKQIDYCYDVDVLIVDRKGSHVLHQKLKNPDEFAWNGCLNNGSRKLPDGAYFYFISYKNAYGKKKYQSGSITILGSRE